MPIAKHFLEEAPAPERNPQLRTFVESERRRLVMTTGSCIEQICIVRWAILRDFCGDFYEVYVRRVAWRT